MTEHRMKMAAPQVMALLLTTCAIGLGGAWGYLHALPADSPTAPPTTAPAAPPIAQPRPIIDTQADSTAGTPTNTPTDPADIIPGGATTTGATERMWEANAQKPWQTRPTPLTRPNWYITGAVQRGTATQVIVEFEGDPQPQFLKIGDRLPGGGTLAWVRANTIGVLTPEKKIVGLAIDPDEPVSLEPPAAKGRKTKNTRH